MNNRNWIKKLALLSLVLAGAVVSSGAVAGDRYKIKFSYYDKDHYGLKIVYRDHDRHRYSDRGYRHAGKHYRAHRKHGRHYRKYRRHGHRHYRHGRYYRHAHRHHRQHRHGYARRYSSYYRW